MANKPVPLATGDIIVLESAAFYNRFIIARVGKVTPSTVMTYPWKRTDGTFSPEGKRRKREAVIGHFLRDENLLLTEDVDRAYDQLVAALRKMEQTHADAFTAFMDVVYNQCWIEEPADD